VMFSWCIREIWLRKEVDSSDVRRVWKIFFSLQKSQGS
jgi:hypothetical protein